MSGIMWMHPVFNGVRTHSALTSSMSQDMLPQCRRTGSLRCWLSLHSSILLSLDDIAVSSSKFRGRPHASWEFLADPLIEDQPE